MEANGEDRHRAGSFAAGFGRRTRMLRINGTAVSASVHERWKAMLWCERSIGSEGSTALDAGIPILVIDGYGTWARISWSRSTPKTSRSERDAVCGA